MEHECRIWPCRRGLWAAEFFVALAPRSIAASGNENDDDDGNDGRGESSDGGMEIMRMILHDVGG